METLKQIFMNSDMLARNYAMEIASCVIEECNIPDFKLKGLTNVQAIPWLLLTDCFYQKQLISKLEFYHVNIENLLLHCIYLFLQPHLDMVLKEQWEQNLRGLPYIQDFQKDNHSYHIQVGKSKINIMALDWYSSNIDVVLLSQMNHFNGSCHQVVKECASFFPNDYITVSQIPALFGDQFLYHSYYTLQNQEGVIDFSGNVFYKENSFEQLVHPIELLKFQARELEERICLLNQEVKDSMRLSPVLRLALHEYKKMKA